MRAISAIAIFTVAALASLIYAGCANRCDYAQVKCQYQCRRTYQTCELHGNDEWYCANQIGECWSNCDATRAGCHSIL
jgi:hypothetical protein